MVSRIRRVFVYEVFLWVLGFKYFWVFVVLGGLRSSILDSGFGVFEIFKEGRVDYKEIFFEVYICYFLRIFRSNRKRFWRGVWGFILICGG